MANKGFGTIAIGIEAPVVRCGDDLLKITVQSTLDALRFNNMTLEDKDIICITESLLARSQGNYVDIKDIAKEVKKKFGADSVLGVVFPIFSRNRFMMLLKAISMGVKHVIVQMSFPCDEVGNSLLETNKFDYLFKDIGYTSFDFCKIFGTPKHPITGVDYINLYQNVSNNISVVISNDPYYLINKVDGFLVSSIHNRNAIKEKLASKGVKVLYTLSDLLTKSMDRSGYNNEFGLLGSNISTENKIKLFPRDSNVFVQNLQAEFCKKTGKQIECLVYGDGAYKDPSTGIWELADPLVCPGYTAGLLGFKSEAKLKMLIDTNQIDNLNSLKTLKIHKDSQSLGTTPRKMTDLLGSLADLVSGSGDKGTPIVLIKNYFKKYGE